MTMEQWNDIKGYEGLYQVSNLGNVKSLVTRIVLSKQKTKKGYLLTWLYKNKSRKGFAIHRLVALHFVFNQLNKPEVNHINGIKSDNRAENLEWCTGSENIKHAFKIGTRVKQFGITNNNPAKLTDEKVMRIKQLYRGGNISIRRLAALYQVDYALIQRIIKGKSWPHVKLEIDGMFV